jgi:hypothetical protein
LCHIQQFAWVHCLKQLVIPLNPHHPHLILPAVALQLSSSSREVPDMPQGSLSEQA